MRLGITELLFISAPPSFLLEKRISGNCTDRHSCSVLAPSARLPPELEQLRLLYLLFRVLPHLLLIELGHPLLGILEGLGEPQLFLFDPLLGQGQGQEAVPQFKGTVGSLGRNQDWHALVVGELA